MVDYNPSIPQGSDNLSTSQGQMLNNFTQLNNIFDFNHFTWNDPTSANRGLHRKVDFPSPTTVAAPTGSASVLYPKTVSGVSSLFFDNASGSSVVWRGGTTNGLVSATTGATTSSGRITFPNGVIFIWGFQATPVDNTQVNFQGGGFPTACFSVILTPTRANTTERAFYISAGSVTNTKFNIRTDSSDFAGVYYLAVGN